MAFVLSTKEMKNHPDVVYIDSVTGVYKDKDGTFYLNDGTPINDYDPNTGAYQEDDLTWYTFQGVALKSYNKADGSYTEEDGTVYTKDGVAKDGSNKKTSIKLLPKKAPNVLLLAGIGLTILGVGYFIFMKGKK